MDDLLANVKPQVFYEMPMAEYMALPGINQSRLWTVVKYNPERFLYEMTHERELETPAMRLGTAVHACIFEPDRFGADYCTGGPINPKTGKSYGEDTQKFKEWAADQGKKPLSEENHALCLAMRDAIYRHPLALDVIRRGKSEVVLQWTHEPTGLLCKARIDLWVESLMRSLDIKTTRLAAPRPFGASAYKYGVHFQAAFCEMGERAKWGEKVRSPLVLAVESEPPHGCVLYDSAGAPDPDALALGRSQVDFCLSVVRKCVDANHWPTYTRDVVPLVMPGYAGNELGADYEFPETPDDADSDDNYIF